MTFAVLIAVRVFEAPDGVKACLVAAPSMGLLLSLFAVQIVRRIGWSVNRAAAGICVVAARSAWLAAAAGRAPAGYLRRDGARPDGDHAGGAAAVPDLPDALPGRDPRPLVCHDRRGAQGDHRRRGGRASAWPLRQRPRGTGGGCWSPTRCACLGMALRAVDAPGVPRRSKRVRLFAAFRHVRARPAVPQAADVLDDARLRQPAGLSLFVEYITNPGYGYRLRRVHRSACSPPCAGGRPSWSSSSAGGCSSTG